LDPEPTPAPSDPPKQRTRKARKCACGHRESKHAKDGGMCVQSTMCPCMRFDPQRTRRASRLRPEWDVLADGQAIYRLRVTAASVMASDDLGNRIGYWTPDERVPLAPKPPKDAP
jgi:hypothetical protein